jgi:hypothetical protein
MAIVLSLCAAYAAFCIGTHPTGPITTPDSIRYLEVWANYPLGYPLFLKIFGPSGAIVAQPLIFSAALAFLGSEIVKLTRDTWLAVAVVAGSMVVPQIREFHSSILSESLFLSFGLVFLALAVRFAYHPSWQLMAALAVAAGASATVRRTGFAWVPVMLAMILMQRRPLRGAGLPLVCVAALAPFFAIFGVEQAAAQIVHGGHASSLTGRHMFAKAALIDAPAAPPSADPTRAALDHHLESDYAPIRALLAEAPADVRGVLSIYYETCLQGGCVDRSRALMPELDEADQTRTLGAAAFARIRRAPVAFLQLLGRNYLSLWTVDRLHHPARTPELNAFIATHRPMPFEDLAFRLEPDQVFEFQPSERVRYMQIAITIVAIWTAAIAVAGVAAIAAGVQLPPLLAIATTAALAAHGSLVLTALLAAGFSRFTLGVWPTIVTAAAVGCAAAVDVLQKMQPRRAPSTR